MFHEKFLESIGATPEVWAAFASYAASGFMLARVSRSIHDEYRLFGASGEFRGQPTGALLYAAASSAELPVTGDWVAMSECGPGAAIVHAVLPRKTILSRRAAGTRGEEQVLAANVDTALIVCGLDQDYNVRRIERYLALTRGGGARAAVILNKADLCPEAEARAAEIRAIAPEASVAALSAHDPESAAILESLGGFGRTLALLGSSGAGKSTLINRLIGEPLLETGAVREQDCRGRHTTTRRELIPLANGGAVIDTPGLREIQLWVGAGSVEDTFPEIASLAAQCRFGDCRHTSEPGCAVRAALAMGTLDAGRWASHLKLLGEARHLEARVDPRAAKAAKQRWKSIHKAVREVYRFRDKP